MGDAAAAYLDARALPQVTLAGIARMRGDATYGAHDLRTWEIDHVSTGRVRTVLNGVAGDMAAGRVYGFRPGDRFSASGDAAEGTYTCRWVQFTWGALEHTRTARAVAIPRQIALTPEASAAYQASFDALLEERASANAGWALRASAHLVQLLGVIASGAGEGVPRRPDRRLTLALAFLERRFASPIFIADAARAAGMSVDYFTRHFRRSIGMAPMQYLVRLQLREARRLLLADPTMGIKDAAKRAGFDDAGHFTKLFRRHYATTPAALQRQGLWRGETTGA